MFCNSTKLKAMYSDSTENRTRIKGLGNLRSIH